MTTFDYTGLRDNTVESLLARFGKSATLTRLGTATGPEWDPTPGTPTEYTVTVVETQFRIGQRDGTLVQQGDRQFLVSTSAGVQPELTDTLTVGSDTYQVVDVEPLQPGAIAMLYRLHVRK